MCNSTSGTGNLFFKIGTWQFAISLLNLISVTSKPIRGMKQPIGVHKSNSLPRTFSPNRGNRPGQSPSSPRSNRTHHRQQSQNVSHLQIK